MIQRRLRLRLKLAGASFGLQGDAERERKSRDLLQLRRGWRHRGQNRKEFQIFWKIKSKGSSHTNGKREDESFTHMHVVSGVCFMKHHSFRLNKNRKWSLKEGEDNV